MSMLRTATIGLLSLVLTVPFIIAADATLDVTPAVVDRKAKSKDIIKETMTLRNASERKLYLYPTVEDVDAHSGDEAFAYAHDANALAESLANWVELSRGVVELAPGEERTLPYIIRVSPNAVPGTYHVRISF